MLSRSRVTASFSRIGHPDEADRAVTRVKGRWSACCGTSDGAPAYLPLPSAERLKRGDRVEPDAVHLGSLVESHQVHFDELAKCGVRLHAAYVVHVGYHFTSPTASSSACRRGWSRHRPSLQLVDASRPVHHCLSQQAGPAAAGTVREGRGGSLLGVCGSMALSVKLG